MFGVALSRSSCRNVRLINSPPAIHEYLLDEATADPD